MRGFLLSERKMCFMKKKIIIAVEIILGVIVLGGGGIIAYQQIHQRQQEKMYQAMQASVEPQLVKQQEEKFQSFTTKLEENIQLEIERSKVYCEKIVDFDELKEENEDIYAWIVVPETKVNYPILQSETDNYYLEHNLDHSKGLPGTIYTNKCDAKDFSGFNSILYGHNMRNGGMFGSLHQFDKEEFFEENSIFYIYTEENRFTYEIFVTRKISDAYLPAYYSFDVQTSQQAYIDMLLGEITDNMTHIREGVEVTTDDKLVTLSTCISGASSNRFIVVGKLIETAYYSE